MPEVDYDFFNLIIIRKCQTRFEGGTKCHLLFSYCVILLFFHYFSNVYNRFFILSVCAWFSGNIAGSCKVMDDTFYTQWNNVVCSLKDNCNIAMLRIGLNREEKTNNKDYKFKVLDR